MGLIISHVELILQSFQISCNRSVTAILPATVRKNCCCPQHTQKNSKTPTSALPCSSGLYAAKGPIAITLWRTPTKLTGDPNLPLLDTPIEAICVIFITFCEISTVLHRNKLIDVSIFHHRCCIFINWREV